jgi:arylsulfatase A-like enzyme
MSVPVSRREFLKASLWLSLSPLWGGQLVFAQGQTGTGQGRAMPNVLVLVFDTLSASQMSLHGFRRNTTPHLAAFAERAFVYHNHYAAGNYTAPGTASLLTGTYPWTHRALHPLGSVAREWERRTLFAAFRGGAYTRIGYAQNTNANVLLYHMQRDLDTYLDQDEFSLGSTRMLREAFRKDSVIADMAEAFLHVLPFASAYSVWVQAQERWITKKHRAFYPRGVPRLPGISFVLDQVLDGVAATLRRARTPFVAYMHLLPPHSPYRPSREFFGRFNDGWTPVAKKPHFFSGGVSDQEANQSRRVYNEYIAYTDAQFGRFYDGMVRTGLADTTCLVVTSDHGELFERGILGHATETLYEPLLRVPLLISTPGQRHRQDIHALTSCVDVLPTLLHLSGQPIPDWCEGEVLPPLSGRKPNPERSVFAVEAKSNPKRARLTKATVALVKGQYKLIRYFGYAGYEDVYELYDLVNDPEELSDLYAERRSIARDLRNELEAALTAANKPYVR